MSQQWHAGRWVGRPVGTVACLCLCAGIGARHASAEINGAVGNRVVLVDREIAARSAPAHDPAEISALLARAEQQIADGRMFSPPNNNAAETFRSLFAMLPPNSDLQAMRNVAAQLSARARAAEAAGRHEEAERFTTWADAFTTSPGMGPSPSPRNVAGAIPPAAPSGAQTPAPSPPPAIAAIAAPAKIPPELSALLAKAEREIAEGRMWSPPDDNAADTFRTLVAKLPQAPVLSLQAMQSIAEQLTAHARAAEAGGRHEEAARFTTWADAFTTPSQADAGSSPPQTAVTGGTALPAGQETKAPPPPSRVASAAPPPSAEPVIARPAGRAEPALPSVPVALLLERGDAMLRLGDIAAARLLYQRAVMVGSARAATSLGKTFDPAVLAKLGVRGMTPDPDSAERWYRKAITMGDRDAESQLQALARARAGPETRRVLPPGKVSTLQSLEMPSILVRAPAPVPAETHCRAIVARVQLGEEPSDAERASLRQGCPLG
jgi:TPR repeat protein